MRARQGQKDYQIYQINETLYEKYVRFIDFHIRILGKVFISIHCNSYICINMTYKT